MRKFLKWFGLGLLLILAVLNLFILFSGRTYLYKGVWNTYLKGRSGPSVNEYAIFENRTLQPVSPQPWPLAARLNAQTIPPDLLAKITGIETGALLIIRRDTILHEQYWGEFSSTSHTNSFSMAKTVVSILVGCAIEDGYIKSIDQPVGDFLPEYKKGDFSRITIKHLLTMSSGISFDEDYVNPLAYPAESYYGSNLRELTFGYDKVHSPPGQTFEYLSGNTQLLGFVLRAATGKPVSDYATQRLWGPAGCEQTAFWSLDHEGGDEKSFCCLNSNARDFARIGKLYLDSGRWNGKQLVPETYALQSVQPAGLKRKDGSVCDDYGYSWWLIPNYNGHRIFYARGILGQYVLCIPDLDMIVVRLGQKRLPNDSDDVPEDVHYYLDAALAMYAK
ncbi:MAG: beta-lactamase family protein [Bacteroidia bacterium]|nr:beta-lactamase family protein [Bacteroidia bacterium]